MNIMPIFHAEGQNKSQVMHKTQRQQNPERIHKTVAEKLLHY